MTQKRNASERLRSHGEGQKQQRFEKICNIYGEQASDRCPVLLQKGAVLKDHLTQTYKLQLKWSNSSTNVIQTAHIAFYVCDQNGQDLSKPISVSYTNVNCEPEACFGSKQLIEVPAQTQTIYIKEIQILFEDQTMQSMGADDLMYIPAPSIDNVYDASHPVYVAQTFENGLHRCSCGGLYGKESRCPNCGNSTEAMRSESVRKSTVYTAYEQAAPYEPTAAPKDPQYDLAPPCSKPEQEKRAPWLGAALLLFGSVYVVAKFTRIGAMIAALLFLGVLFFSESVRAFFFKGYAAFLHNNRISLVDRRALKCNQQADEMVKQGTTDKNFKNSKWIVQIVALCAELLLPLNLVACGEQKFTGLYCWKKTFSMNFQSGDECGALVVTCITIACILILVCMYHENLSFERYAKIFDLQELIAASGLYLLIYYMTNQNYRILLGGFLLLAVYMLHYPAGLRHFISMMANYDVRIPEQITCPFLTYPASRRLLLGTHFMVFGFLLPMMNGKEHYDILWMALAYFAVVIELKATAGHNNVNVFAYFMGALEGIQVILQAFVSSAAPLYPAGTFFISFMMMLYSPACYLVYFKYFHKNTSKTHGSMEKQAVCILDDAVQEHNS